LGTSASPKLTTHNRGESWEPCPSKMPPRAPSSPEVGREPKGDNKLTKWLTSPRPKSPFQFFGKGNPDGNSTRPEQNPEHASAGKVSETSNSESQADGNGNQGGSKSDKPPMAKAKSQKTLKRGATVHPTQNNRRGIPENPRQTPKLAANTMDDGTSEWTVYKSPKTHT